jgi:hypothetical protein
LFARALENPMAVCRAAKASRKARCRKADSRHEPGTPMPPAPTPSGPVPPERCTLATGTGGEPLPSDAAATAEHVPLSCLDANSPSLQAPPSRGRKRKARAPRTKKVSAAPPIAPVTSVGAARQGGAEQVPPEVTATAPGGNRKSKRRVSKLVTGMTLKRGCHCLFVAKQVYVDPTLCELQYHCWNHVTLEGKVAHGIAFDGFRYALGGRLTAKTVKWIENMIRQGFSTRQVMQLYQEHILEVARQVIKPTRDTFIMLDDIHNIAKKRA